MALKRIGNSISNIAGEIGKTVANTSHKVANNISKIDKDKINETRVNIHYELPLSEIVYDFFDNENQLLHGHTTINSDCLTCKILLPC